MSESQVHLMTCQRFSPECMQCQISKIADAIWSGRYSQQKELKKVIYEGMSEEEKDKVEFG